MWPFKRKVATGGALGGAAVPDKPSARVIKKPDFHETPADRLDWYCARYGCTYSIQRTPTERIVRLSFNNGDTVVTGRGANAAAAVAEAIRLADKARA
jgi:hypothetical protein